MKIRLVYLLLFVSLVYSQDSSFGIDFSIVKNNFGSNNNSVSVGQFNLNTSGNIPGVKLKLNYYKNNYSMFASLGVYGTELKNEVSVFNTSSSSSVIVPLLVGFNYYFNLTDDEVPLKPYVSAAAGMYIGFQQKSAILSVESRTETSIGGIVSGGVDFELLNWLKLNLEAGYNFVSDFNNLIGTKKNYSGAELSIGMGLKF